VTQAQTPQPRRSEGESLQDQVRRREISPVTSVASMTGTGAFADDEEVEEFVAFVYAERQAHQGGPSQTRRGSAWSPWTPMSHPWLTEAGFQPPWPAGSTA